MLALKYVMLAGSIGFFGAALGLLVNDLWKEPGRFLLPRWKGTVRLALAACVPQRLPYVQSSLPRPVETEIMPPVVANAFRQTISSYMVRDVFSTKRAERSLIVRVGPWKICKSTDPQGVRPHLISSRPGRAGTANSTSSYA
jgi:hypothetical protein